MRKKLKKHRKSSSGVLFKDVIFFMEAFICIVIAGAIAALCFLKDNDGNSIGTKFTNMIPMKKDTPKNSKKNAPTISKKDANDIMDMLEAIYELNRK